jgi:uncharacterized caspase-like protein/TolA-binding protein
MNPILLRSFLLVFVLAAGIAGAAAAEPGRGDARVALVIGNSAYRAVPKLANPANDARLIGERLKALGFEVELALDQDRSGMEHAVRRFGDRARGAAVALFFYAGHAAQLDEQNYLLPVGAELHEARDLPFETLAVEAVTAQMRASARLDIVILDACRDNPFRAALEAARGTRSAAVGKGLAPPSSTSDAVYIYSTEAGRVAEDGRAANSPFSAALAKYIAAPGLEIHQVMSRVTQEVDAETQGRQRPTVYSNQRDDFFFVPAVAQAVPAPSPPQPAPEAVAASPSRQATDPRYQEQADNLYWESLDKRNAGELRAYLAQFPNGRFTSLAKLKLDELADKSAPPRAAVAATPAPPPAPVAAPAAAKAAPAAPVPAKPDAPPPAAAEAQLAVNLPPPPVEKPLPRVEKPVVERASGSVVMIRATALRAEPRSDAQVRHQMVAGTTVALVQRLKSGEWLNVRVDGRLSGWIEAADARPFEEVETEEWGKLGEAADRSALEGFLTRFPKGAHAAAAGKRLAGLRVATVPPAGARAPEREGTSTNPADKTPPSAPPPAEAPPPLDSQLPADSQSYDRALGLLASGDNAAAEALLLGIIKADPSSVLAGNAHFWLGEIAFRRGDFATAAKFYADVTQSRRGGNMPVALVKLGASLAHLDRRGDACSALQQFSRDYPGAESTLREEAQRQRSGLKC